MVNARRRNAPRKGIAAILLALLVPAPAFAGGELQLVLPLVAALSLGTSAARAVSDGDSRGALAAGLARILPAQLRIPTMEPKPYKLRKSPRYTAGIDTDLLVGIDVLDRRRGGGGWTVSVHVDDESRVPLAGSSNAVSVIAEFRF